MASAEGGSVPSGVRYGKGCPLSSRLRGLGERRELPQRDPGQSPGCPGRIRILAYFEGHKTLIFVPVPMTISGGTICISAPRSKFWEGPHVPPWSTPMIAISQRNSEERRLPRLLWSTRCGKHLLHLQPWTAEEDVGQHKSHCHC